MDMISSEMEREIEQRLAAGPYGSADELLRDALKALDNSREAAQDWLEKELLKGLEGEDVAITGDDWDDIEREALRILEAKKTQ